MLKLEVFYSEWLVFEGALLRLNCKQVKEYFGEAQILDVSLP